jgi:hypothetical protein
MSRLPLLCIAPLFVASCVTDSAVDSSFDDGEITTIGGSVSWTGVDGGPETGLLVENRGHREVEVSVSALTPATGTQTAMQDVQTGVREVEYCDPVTHECHIHEEAVYERVPVVTPLSVVITAYPSRFILGPGVSARIIVSLDPAGPGIACVASIELHVAGRRDRGQVIEFVFGPEQ